MKTEIAGDFSWHTVETGVSISGLYNLNLYNKMPLYEYHCQDCQQSFELLVNASTVPRCPACESECLEKQFSTFSPGGGKQMAPAGPLPECQTCGVPGGPCGLN